MTRIPNYFSTDDPVADRRQVEAESHNDLDNYQGPWEQCPYCSGAMPAGESFCGDSSCCDQLREDAIEACAECSSRDGCSGCEWQGVWM